MSGAAPTLEQLLDAGEATSALLVKGDFTDAELKLIQQAYSTGIQHGRAAALAAASGSAGNTDRGETA